MDLPTLTNVLFFFEDKLSEGRSYLFGDVTGITNLIVIFEVVFAGLYLALGTSTDLKAVARKLLLIGFFFYVIRYYGEILQWVVDGFLYAGQKAGSGSSLDFATLRDPAKVFVHGMQIAKPAVDKLFSDMSSSYLGIPSVDGLMLLVCLVITVFSFAIMSIQVLVTYLEYLLVATAGFILIPFGIFKPTAFIAERVFGAIISFGVKLMVLALVIGLSDSFLSTLAVPAEVTWQQAIELSVIALALAFLALHAPSVAQSLLSGVPHLSFGSVVGTAAGAAFVASRAATAPTSFGSATLAATGAMHAGGASAASSLGSIKEETSSLGKMAKAASKMSAYATGAASGPLAGATMEVLGKLGYGNGGSPNGSRAYREKIDDPSLRSSTMSGRGSSGGMIGSFRAGKYSVPQYRTLDEKKRKDASIKEDQATKQDSKKESDTNTRKETTK